VFHEGRHVRFVLDHQHPRDRDSLHATYPCQSVGAARCPEFTGRLIVGYRGRYADVTIR
jgi:hypothetical protein